MRLSLLICLKLNGQVSWATYDSTGQIIDSEKSVALNQVPQGIRVITVLIPSTDILLTSVNLPTKSKQRIKQAVPYILEEQLIDDIENLHFAISSASGNIPIVVISKTQLQFYLQQLKEHNLNPKILLPDVLALPYIENSWVILSFDDRLLVRIDLYNGFSIEEDALIFSLKMLLAVPKTKLPEKILLLNQLDADLLNALASLDIPLEEATTKPNSLTWMTQTLVSKTKTLNLLQGYYNVKNKISSYLRIWRLTAVLLLTLTILYFTEQAIEYKQLIQQSQTLDRQIKKTYQASFPESQRIVNPRVQMEQKLKILKSKNTQAQNKNSHFLSILNQVTPIIIRIKGFRLKQIEYRQNYLNLQVEVANLQALELLKQNLNSLNLTLEIQSAVSQNNFVKSRLRIQSIN
ncbi:MAG: type II secretion system protein GspL [Thiomargarita sp.]|nr:type II secretion system protein GspL [Thiomargarita sp.]